MPDQQTQTGISASVEPNLPGSQLKVTGSAALEATLVTKIGCRIYTTLAAVVVTPATAALAAAETVQLKLVGTDAVGNDWDLTGVATWVTADAAVATVSESGLVTAVAAGGPVNITGTVGAQSDACAVTVS